MLQGGQGRHCRELTSEQKSEEIKEQASGAPWGVVQCRGEAHAGNADLGAADLQEAFKTF